MPELLAPAGDFERIKIAFLYGADAVYFGGKKYSLRANAKNLDIDEIDKATKYAHERGKKVYVAVNIIFHNDDLEGIDDYLKSLNDIHVDGIIVSDLLVIKRVNGLGLNLKLILSTQASIMNEYTAKFYKDLGVKQLVMARECLKEDIIKIKKETGLEIECFIHGAMCSSISGKCILSNFTTGRDANRGGCAQICRWVFNETDDYPFTVTAKDLNMLDYLEDMINIGVNTYKIEGRMRSIYYIATVILCYRRCIDKILNHSLTEDDKKYYLKVLNRCANRDSAPQFYNKLPDYTDQYYNLRDEDSNQDFLGIVLDYDEKNHMVTLEQRNKFNPGDEVEFISPTKDTFSCKIVDIYDEDGNVIDTANKPRMIVKFRVDKALDKLDMMRVKL